MVIIACLGLGGFSLSVASHGNLCRWTMRNGSCLHRQLPRLSSCGHWRSGVLWPSRLGEKRLIVVGLTLVACSMMAAVSQAWGQVTRLGHLSPALGRYHRKYSHHGAGGTLVQTITHKGRRAAGFIVSGSGLAIVSPVGRFR